MRRFLRETWELWYWAMFCPSRLQQRMNDWSSKPGNTAFFEILLTHISWRFLSQFLSLTCFFSIPLIVLLLNHPHPTAWLLPPITLMMAYGGAVWFLPVAIHIPLIVGFLYGIDLPLFRETIQMGWSTVATLLPSMNQLIIGIGSGALLLGLTAALVHGRLKRQNLSTARLLLILGTASATVIGAWIGTQSLLFTSLTGICAGLFSYAGQNRLNANDDELGVAVGVMVVAAGSVAVGIAGVVADSITDGITSVTTIAITVGVTFIVAGVVAFSVAVSVAFFAAFIVALSVLFGVASIVASIMASIISGIVAGIVASGVAVGVAVVIAATSQISLLPFLAIVTIGSFSLSYGQRCLWGLVASAVFVILGAENLGWQVLWVPLVTLSVYYRILPEYIIFAALSIGNGFISAGFMNAGFMNAGLNVLNHPLFQVSASNSERWLQQLPPFNSELLWLPLPGHAPLLARVFQHNSALGLLALEKMQASPLPGLTRTARHALPDIVANQLLKLDKATQFQRLVPNTADCESHHLLKTLLPTYYDTTQDADRDNPAIPVELSVLFPQLQTIAQDTASALQASNFALRERNLECVLDRLKQLPAQLPDFGFNANGIRRWQPVLSHWQHLLTLELAAQQQTAIDDGRFQL